MPKLERMASGNLCIVLAEDVAWQNFPMFATRLLEVVGGSSESGVDTPVDRIRDVTILGQPFWLTYEDYPCRVTLDAKTPVRDVIVEHLLRTIAKLYDS
jgi:hypothetical protein